MTVPARAAQATIGVFDQSALLRLFDMLERNSPSEIAIVARVSLRPSPAVHQILVKAHPFNCYTHST
ncbi:MAG: hypothetical protein EOP89_03320 [Lysobacteraceae bacterium]|nr:MAG: hypothetical protein EOP89_03320 [Xanthomonadaceae bacterium]